MDRWVLGKFWQNVFHYVTSPNLPLPRPHDYMKTINVSCRYASNQLRAYDSHYLHLSRRVSGAQLGLHRREGLVLVLGLRGGGNVVLDQFCRLPSWFRLTLNNGCSKVACVCVCACVWERASQRGGVFLWVYNRVGAERHGIHLKLLWEAGGTMRSVGNRHTGFCVWGWTHVCTPALTCV